MFLITKIIILRNEKKFILYNKIYLQIFSIELYLTATYLKKGKKNQ